MPFLRDDQLHRILPTEKGRDLCTNAACPPGPAEAAEEGRVALPLRRPIPAGPATAQGLVQVDGCRQPLALRRDAVAFGMEQGALRVQHFDLADRKSTRLNSSHT